MIQSVGGLCLPPLSWITTKPELSPRSVKFAYRAIKRRFLSSIAVLTAKCPRKYSPIPPHSDTTAFGQDAIKRNLRAAELSTTKGSHTRGRSLSWWESERASERGAPRSNTCINVPWEPREGTLQRTSSMGLRMTILFSNIASSQFVIQRVGY